MKWTFKNQEFHTIAINWYDVFHSKKAFNYALYRYIRPEAIATSDGQRPDFFNILVYLPKHDSVYTVTRFGIFGNGKRIKFELEDVYTRHSYFCDIYTTKVELVLKQGDFSRVDFSVEYLKEIDDLTYENNQLKRELKKLKKELETIKNNGRVN